MNENNPHRILYIERDARFQVRFQTVAAGFGLAPTIVGDVSDGLSLHRLNPFDVIFVGSHAKGKGGTAVARAILETVPNSTVIILNFATAPEDTHEARPHGFCVFDIENNVTLGNLLPGILGLAKDRTDSIRRNRELATELQDQKTIHHQAETLAEIGTWEWDDDEDKMLWCSEQHAKIHGVSHDEYMASVTSVETDTSWVHPEDQERYLRQTMHAYLNAQELNIEYRIVRRDGETVFVRELSDPVCDETGRVIRTFGTMQNITEIKLAEAKLLRAYDNLESKVRERTAELEKAKNAAEAANQAKSQFLSTINHELRTPLTSIKGCLGLLHGSAREELSENGRMLLDMASRNAESLSLLINDLLDYEKNAVGKLKIDLSPHDVVGLLRNVIEDSRGYAETFSVNFLLQEDAACFWARVNEHRFGQVMLNLLSNAAKFSPPGNNIDITVHKKDGAVHVGVRDYGIGISAEHQNRVFEHFIQLDSSDTRHQSGTGLGLAITKSLVEKMHGAIRVDSEPGVGSTFTVSFPCIEEAHASQLAE